MEQREAAICQWFDMWLTKRDTGIRDLFAPDAVYIESWGPDNTAILQRMSLTRPPTG